MRVSTQQDCEAQPEGMLVLVGWELSQSDLCFSTPCTLLFSFFFQLHHCAVLDFFILGLWILLSRLCVGWDLENDMFKMILQFHNKIHVFVKTILLIIYICFWFHVCNLFIDCLSFLSSISHVIRATETLDVLTTYTHLSYC